MNIYHQHHIIPRHMGGTDDSSNLILLTIEEHAEAHRLLYEEHGRWQDKVAWLGLTGQIGMDEMLAMRMSEGGRMGGWTRKGKEPGNKGKPQPEYIKAKKRKPKQKTTCPHCGREGGISAMYRWHFDNCSLIISK